MKTLRLFLLFLSCFIFSSPSQAGDTIQSRFVGPVKLSVWQHWQASWNAERHTNFPTQFEVTRGFKETGGPFLRLIYVSSSRNSLRARLSGRAFIRDGAFSDKEQDIPSVEVFSRNDGSKQFFELNNDLFLDRPGQVIVTRISFEIFDGDRKVYSYDLLPMFVRGKNNFHWSQEIDAYSAHAGSGSIVVSNGTSAESGLDFWNGVAVKPSLQFIDRNTLKAGADIGLHRHEANQEMWLVEEGLVRVSHAVVPISSGTQMVSRVWSSSGDVRQVPQFEAQGGWLEERTLSAGEYSIIVPNPALRDSTVCAHALQALSDTKTFTMGTKN